MQKLKLSATLLFALATSHVGAADLSMNNLIRARLAGEGAVVKEIAKSPINGLLEVILTDNTVMYASADGAYFVVGDIIDAVNKKAVTRERAAQVMASDFPSLPHHLTIKSGTPGAKAKVFVVADPNCPYCHRHYKKLKLLPNIEVETLLVAVLGADSQKKAMSILCAANPQAAYESYIEGTPPRDATCAAGEKTLRGAFEWLKLNPIKTTPTTIFNNGRIEQGEMSVDQIQKNL